MILLIAGASHTGKTALAQKLLEKCICVAYLFCKQLYDLALLSNKPLSSEEMTAFIQRSNDIMMLLAKY